MNKHIINRIIQYFTDNADIFNQCIEELDEYTAFLDDGPYYSMDDFDDVCYGMTSYEIADRVYGGYDEDTLGVFNPNREYFRLNANGVFVSSSEKNYMPYICENIVLKMCQYRTNIPEIYVHDDLLELFYELDS